MISKRSLTSILGLLITLTTAGCAALAAPGYVQPHDPFELANAEYRKAAPHLEQMVRRMEAERGVNTLTTEEKQAFYAIARLAGEGHVPSKFLFGYSLIAVSGELRESAGLQKAQIKEADEDRQLGYELLHTAARYGFPAARDILVKAGVTAPGKDLYTRAEEQARARHQQALQAQQSERNAGGAIAAGLALRVLAAAVDNEVERRPTYLDCGWGGCYRIVTVRRRTKPFGWNPRTGWPFRVPVRRRGR